MRPARHWSPGVTRSGEDDPAALVTRMMADVHRARAGAPIARRRDQDAAPELWTLRGLTTEARLRHWHKGLIAIT